MVRRYIFVKLKPEHRSGLKLTQLLERAKEVLHVAHAVQSLHIGRAVDDATREQWDLCLTLEFASAVDMERCVRDAVTRAFIGSYLEPRADAVWSSSFEGDRVGPRRR